MQKLRARLPPLNSLVAFEASARHLSFTRAAQELAVSREAVSRQIRILENHMGVKLFARLYRALELTPAGQCFHQVVRQSLEQIAESASDLRPTAQPTRVTITATVAIASYWLTPRLPRFRAEQPDTEIRVVVSDPPLDLAANGIDVGLRYGDGNWPGVRSTHLFDVDSYPVCAPSYLAASGPIENPGDLVAHTLLNLDGVTHAQEDWAWWLQESGVPDPASLRILGFDNYVNVIQAASDGQGITLGFSGIVDPLVAAGSLVRPLDSALPTGRAVYLIAPAEQRLSPRAKAFYDWVLAEAA